MKRALAVMAVLGVAWSASAAPPPAAATDERLRYEDAAGRTLLKIKRKESAYRLVQGEDTPLGEIKVQDDRVKLKDAADIEIRKIKQKPDGAEMEDATGHRLYRIKPGDAGDWKIVGPGDDTLVKCKAKDNGYEVRNASGSTLAKVKVRDGRLVFETEAGQRIAVLKGITDARAGMWMAAEPLTLAERAALVVYFTEVQR